MFPFKWGVANMCTITHKKYQQKCDQLSDWLSDKQAYF